MTITNDDANRLAEIQQDMASLLNEFKKICRKTMSSNEYQDFKYRTLGHIEPVVSEETEWVTAYSSIDSLEKVVQKAVDSVEEEEEEIEMEDDHELPN